MLEDRPMPPKSPSDVEILAFEVNEKEQKKLKRKVTKWKVLTILMSIITIASVVIFVYLYWDLQNSKEYWFDRYDAKYDEVKKWEKQWKLIEDCGYIGENYAIEIIDIGNGQGGNISDRDMIAENMYYMTIKFIVHLVDQDATWKEPFYIDVVHPDGKILTNPEKDNHCYKVDLSSNTGTSHNRWFGWGSQNTGSLDPGVYVILFYEGDTIIQRQEIILK